MQFLHAHICHVYAACEFECDNGECIPENFVCNGIDGCGDNSDEQNCGMNDYSCMFLSAKFDEHGLLVPLCIPSCTCLVVDLSPT